VLHSPRLPRARSNMRYILLILTLALAAGCGSKGALFLPAKEPAAAQPAAAQPGAPQDAEKEPFPEPVEEQEDEDDVNL